MEKVIVKKEGGKTVKTVDNGELQDGQFCEDPFFLGAKKDLLVKIEGYHLLVVEAADFDTQTGTILKPEKYFEPHRREQSK